MVEPRVILNKIGDLLIQHENRLEEALSDDCSQGSDNMGIGAGGQIMYYGLPSAALTNFYKFQLAQDLLVDEYEWETFVLDLFVQSRKTVYSIDDISNIITAFAGGYTFFCISAFTVKFMP